VELGGIYIFDLDTHRDTAIKIISFLLNKLPLGRTVLTITSSQLQSFYASWGFTACEDLDSVPEKLLQKLFNLHQELPLNFCLLQMNNSENR
jgi:hypothetical protein